MPSNPAPMPRLFGILPIGVLGLVGYFAILVAWLVTRFSHNFVGETARLVLFGLTVLGLLFSIYLTFLEPFIIGASCMWCLASAVLMTAFFLVSIAPARSARLFLSRSTAPKF